MSEPIHNPRQSDTMTGKMLLHDWIPSTLTGDSGRTTTRARSPMLEAPCSRERSSFADDMACAHIPTGSRAYAKSMGRATAHAEQRHCIRLEPQAFRISDQARQSGALHIAKATENHTFRFATTDSSSRDLGAL
ncbi:hypothetical protein [Paraburkholderia sp. BL10I2N1]|uniref:hypothetical protein n=1 Tax=Paraburkholderia sp. BL10I2N1 TaxID=1938796 RepID=UPI0010616CF1|nr:hypothetical protein [Paraburkholderia sp. BL10I2N1]